MNTTLVIGKHGTGKTRLLHRMTKDQVIAGREFRHLPPAGETVAIDDAHEVFNAYAEKIESDGDTRIILAFPSIKMVPKYIIEGDPHIINLD